MQPYSPTPADLPRRTPVRASGVPDESVPCRYHFSVFDFSVFEYSDSVCLKPGCLESGVRSLWRPISSVRSALLWLSPFKWACSSACVAALACAANLRKGRSSRSSRAFKAARHDHFGPIPCAQASPFRQIFQALFWCVFAGAQCSTLIAAIARPAQLFSQSWRELCR
jgi:hypothetical protein